MTCLLNANDLSFKNANIVSFKCKYVSFKNDSPPLLRKDFAKKSPSFLLLRSRQPLASTEASMPPPPHLCAAIISPIRSRHITHTEPSYHPYGAFSVHDVHDVHGFFLSNLHQ